MFGKLLRLAGLIALATAIVWLTREHLLPTPRVSHEPPPHYRSTPPPPDEEAAPPEEATQAMREQTPRATPDDLTAIKGIGPVFAARFEEMGVTSFGELAEQDPQAVADAVGTSTQAARDWITQAQARAM
jgi:predicted flap endonuclease-1-like 5' DNA nuclease